MERISNNLPDVFGLEEEAISDCVQTGTKEMEGWEEEEEGEEDDEEKEEEEEKESSEKKDNEEEEKEEEGEEKNGGEMDGFGRERRSEIMKMGNGGGKSGDESDIRKVNMDLTSGGSIPKWIERRNGATLLYVPLANFLMRLHEKDPQTAALCGEEHNDVTWVQLKRHALSGRMRPEAVEKIKNWWTQQNSIESVAQKVDDARRLNEGDQPAWREIFSFKEIWLSFDVDGDGVDEEIVVDFHKESMTLLSARYNWYDDGHRPYRSGV